MVRCAERLVGRLPSPALAGTDAARVKHIAASNAPMVAQAVLSTTTVTSSSASGYLFVTATFFALFTGTLIWLNQEYLLQFARISCLPRMLD
jgi:hypothetical protein